MSHCRNMSDLSIIQLFARVEAICDRCDFAEAILPESNLKINCDWGRGFFWFCEHSCTFVSGRISDGQKAVSDRCKLETSGCHLGLGPSVIPSSWKAADATRNCIEHVCVCACLEVLTIFLLAWVYASREFAPCPLLPPHKHGLPFESDQGSPWVPSSACSKCR